MSREYCSGNIRYDALEAHAHQAAAREEAQRRASEQWMQRRERAIRATVDDLGPTLTAALAVVLDRDENDPDLAALSWAVDPGRSDVKLASGGDYVCAQWAGDDYWMVAELPDGLRVWSTRTADFAIRAPRNDFGMVFWDRIEFNDLASLGAALIKCRAATSKFNMENAAAAALAARRAEWDARPWWRRRGPRP